MQSAVGGRGIVGVAASTVGLSDRTAHRPRSMVTRAEMIFAKSLGGKPR